MQTFRMPRDLVTFLKDEAAARGSDLTGHVVRHLDGVRTWFGLPERGHGAARGRSPGAQDGPLRVPAPPALPAQPGTPREGAGLRRADHRRDAPQVAARLGHAGPGWIRPHASGRPAPRLPRDRPLRLRRAGSPTLLRRGQQEADVPPARKALRVGRAAGGGALPSQARLQAPGRAGGARLGAGAVRAFDRLAAGALASATGLDGHRGQVPGAHPRPERRARGARPGPARQFRCATPRPPVPLAQRGRRIARLPGAPRADRSMASVGAQARRHHDHPGPAAAPLHRGRDGKPVDRDGAPRPNGRRSLEARSLPDLLHRHGIRRARHLVPLRLPRRPRTPARLPRPLGRAADARFSGR